MISGEGQRNSHRNHTVFDQFFKIIGNFDGAAILDLGQFF